jgi:aspartate kinase
MDGVMKKGMLKVLKFGGGIFTDQYQMPVIESAIRNEMHDGDKLIIVASAMGKTTRGLLREIPGELIPAPDPREKDLLMSIGENKAISLLTMYLLQKKYKAKSFTGGQAGIITDDNFGDADIIDIKTDGLRNFLQNNDIAVVAGFQGETRSGDITTLGFNGSDTTAFYLAHYFSAGLCSLYKDVNGVYDKNPKDYPDARLYKALNYKEVLNGETKGIIHERALKLCKEMFKKNPNMEIIIRNINLSQNQFTTICKKRTEFYR